MGNCLAGDNNKIVSSSSQDDDDKFEQEAKKTVMMRTSSNTGGRPEFAAGSGRWAEGGKKNQKKMVRLKSGDHIGHEEEGKIDNGDDGMMQVKSRSAGAVRIRVVVTKDELKEILKHHGKELTCSSVEQFVRAVKLREHHWRFDEGRDRSRRDANEEGFINGGWRPALESIPEDH